MIKTSYIIALYIRLSVEDCKVDSLSVENQKRALHQYVESVADFDGAEVQEFTEMEAWCKNLCKRNSTKSRMTLRKQGRLGAEALPNRRSRRTGRYARRWRCECRPGCRDNLRERVSQRPGRRT